MWPYNAQFTMPQQRQAMPQQRTAMPQQLGAMPSFQSQPAGNSDAIAGIRAAMSGRYVPEFRASSDPGMGGLLGVSGQAAQPMQAKLSGMFPGLGSMPSYQQQQFGMQPQPAARYGMANNQNKWPAMSQLFGRRW
jgi:hypothetical protein